MSDLIWIGNTLVPRGVLIGVAILFAISLSAFFIWLNPDA